MKVTGWASTPRSPRGGYLAASECSDKGGRVLDLQRSPLGFRGDERRDKSDALCPLVCFVFF